MFWVSVLRSGAEGSLLVSSGFFLLPAGPVTEQHHPPGPSPQGGLSTSGWCLTGCVLTPDWLTCCMTLPPDCFSFLTTDSLSVPPADRLLVLYADWLSLFPTDWLLVLPADWLSVLLLSQVQKMWNWRIPADFHIKPSVRFLRYRFQCTSDQSAASQSPDPAH